MRNVNTFQLKRAGSETILTWSMRGPKPRLARLLGLIFNVDKAMFKHFDDGRAPDELLTDSRQLKLIVSAPGSEPALLSALPRRRQVVNLSHPPATNMSNMSNRSHERRN